MADNPLQQRTSLVLDDLEDFALVMLAAAGASLYTRDVAKALASAAALRRTCHDSPAIYLATMRLLGKLETHATLTKERLRNAT